jgi:1D-myo-inositol 3-kinase
LSIGHVSKDRLPDGNFTHGGTVVYSSVTARRFGWSPEIIMACESGFKAPEPFADVRWHITPSPVSTTFRNDYGPSSRTQTIEVVASHIEAIAVPAQCRQATLVHVAPLAQEMGPAIVSLFPDAFLVSTPQGWLREWNDAGAVRAARWADAEKVLPQLEAAVVSIEDISGDWTIAETWASLVPVLVVTQDEQGCTIFHQGKKEHVPPQPHPGGCLDGRRGHICSDLLHSAF